MNTVTFSMPPRLDHFSAPNIESHRGTAIDWGFSGQPTCCSECLIDELRGGTAVLANADDVLAGARRLRNTAGFEGLGLLLDRIVRAWNQRGVADAERLVVALEAAARMGGPLADRMCEALSALFDAVGPPPLTVA